MVVFSFVPTAKRGFFVSSFSSRSSTCLPPLLDATIKNTNEAGEDICYVSVGLDGSYFLGTQKRNNHYGYTNFPPLLTLFEAASASSPGTFSSDSVRWISFTPDHKGYFMCFVLADQKPLYAWACLPESLNKILEGNAIEDNDVLNFVSFGKDGSWVLTIEGKKPMWDGVPKDLEERLRGSDTIATVALALDAEDEYFMEYEDGGIWMIIPKEWHRTVKPHLDDKGAIEQINVCLIL
ncbi:hypothetical protein CPB83DRAFT_644988 [Crepidotus variabilis]|uniref:Uncharacterized protein n=1 Tax=Crepidotus variabilis TaxID=179855 RepID=A0A9P6E7E6_9AGAR|nr:hypothetical protein CPB83DRAFT_644988 [Crepidotus variabilis]